MGQNRSKTHIQSFNYTLIIKDSDGEFCAEFNGANPRAKNLPCKKLYPKKALQKHQILAKKREKTLSYI